MRVVHRERAAFFHPSIRHPVASFAYRRISLSSLEPRGNVIKIPFSDEPPLPLSFSLFFHESAMPDVASEECCEKHRRNRQKRMLRERERRGRENGYLPFVKLLIRDTTIYLPPLHDDSHPEISTNFPFCLRPRFSAEKGVKAPRNLLR